METALLQADEGIGVAVELLKKENVVALPTETVYGLAADAFSSKGVASIFEAKQRPLSDPLIVHLLDASWLNRVVALTPELEKRVTTLAEAFWPGPLTLLLPRNAAVPDLVTAGLETVAVRVPANPLFRKVLKLLDRPLAAPSANRFGRISPTTAADVMMELGEKIPLILDGGACQHGVESTIVWLSNSTERAHRSVAPVLASSSTSLYTQSLCAVAPSAASLSANLDAGCVLQILRPGPITAEMLAAFGNVITQSVSGKAPGSLESHYAPRKKLSWYDFKKSPQPNVGFLAFSKKIPGFGAIEVLSLSGDLVEAAANLYGALRRLDESGVDLLVVEPVPEVGIGNAIMDRLKRAIA